MNLNFRPLKIFLSTTAQLASLVLMMLSVLPASAADPEPASPAKPANNERTLPDSSKAEILLEERLVNKGVWLGGNDQNRFLGLYNAAVTTTSKGNVLLIGYAGTRPGDAGELGTLWRSLAELGWNTLLIPLPVLPEKPIPQRGQASSATDSAATASTAASADSAATAKSTATPPSSETEAYSRLLQDWQTQSRQRIEAGLAHLRKLSEQDAVIITEGIAAQFSYVELSRSGPEGERVVARYGPGEFFGEIAVLLGRPRTTRAVAVGDARVLQLDRATFESMCVDRPEIALRVIQRLAQRAIELEQRLTALGVDDLLRPVVRVLIKHGSGGAKSARIETNLRKLANEAGLRVNEAHRALNQLLDQKLVRLVDDALEVRDFEALAAALDPGE